MANCAYCSKPTNAYIYQDHVFCSARHADLWADREEIANDPRSDMYRRRVVHDVGLDAFRRETRREGGIPRRKR